MLKYSGCCLVLMVLFVTLPSTLVDAQVNQRRDGNWWIELSPLPKLDYVVGFFDGMELGGHFSFWGSVATSEKKKNGCAADAVESYEDYKKKYFKDVTNGQMTKGLDTFYSDYRNRKIKVYNAMWIVANEIAGTSRSTIEKMTENWRKSPD